MSCFDDLPLSVRATELSCRTAARAAADPNPGRPAAARRAAHLAASMPRRHTSHTEAAARIAWCIGEHGLGVITGEVGAGKTFALRAAVAFLDPARHTVIYLPNPAVGMRGLHEAVVTTLGGTLRCHTP